MTDSREKLTEIFLAFLEYCCNSGEVEYVQPGFAFYPIGLTDEQADNARNLGLEIIRKMSDPMIDKIITRNGATGYYMKVFPTSGSEYTQYNDRNAGYIVYNLIFAAMGYANGGDFNKQTTFGEFSAAIQQALAMEFPGFEIPEIPEQTESSEQTEQKKAELLPVLTEIKPKNAILPHSLIAKAMTTPEPWGGSWQQMSLPGFPIKERKATTYFSMEWSAEDSGITLSRKMSPYDESVANAVYSLYEAGNGIITTRQICAQMKALESSNSGIDAAAINKTTKSIEKQRRTMAKIDATEVFERRGITDYTAKIETYFLPLRKITVKGKGKKERMEAYQFIEQPPVLANARALKQISTVPMEILQIENTNMTDDMIVLRDYLIRRVEAAKNKRLTKKMLYSTIYDLMDLAEPSLYSYLNATDEATGEIVTAETAYKRDLHNYQKKAATVRKNVKKILSSWVKKQYIKGYSENKKGKTIEAVTLEL